MFSRTYRYWPALCSRRRGTWEPRTRFPASASGMWAACCAWAAAYRWAPQWGRSTAARPPGLFPGFQWPCRPSSSVRWPIAWTYSVGWASSARPPPNPVRRHPCRPPDCRHHNRPDRRPPPPPPQLTYRFSCYSLRQLMRVRTRYRLSTRYTIIICILYSCIRCVCVCVFVFNFYLVLN